MPFTAPWRRRPARGRVRRSPPVAVLLAALPALLTAGGCADEDGVAPLPPGGSVGITVRDRSDGAPQAGVDLVLLDADANRIQAGPAATDAAGRVVFAGLPGGHFKLLAFPGGGRGLHHLPASFRLPAGAGGDGRLELAVKTLVAPAYADRLPRIRGRIVAAGSEAPLAGAFVGTPGTLDAYVGGTSVREDVTGADGAFHVADIPFTVDPQTGRVIQILPLVVQREGYRPAVWFHEPRPGDDSLDIEGVRIALSPLDGGAGGVIEGTVLCRGRAVPGLPVGATYRAGPTVGKVAGEAAGTGIPVAAGRPGMPGLVTVTDADGAFRLEGLASGWYLVHPGFQDDDGYTVIGSAAALSVLVTGEAPAVAAGLPVLHTLVPLAPAADASVPDTLRTLAWLAVAEADSYVVALDGVAVGGARAARFRLPAGAALEPGFHTWEAAGLARDGSWVAFMDRPVRFAATGDDSR